MSQFSPTSKYRSNNHESSSSAASDAQKSVEAKLEGPLEINFQNTDSETSPLKIPHVDPFSSKPLPNPMPSTAVDYTDPFDVKSRLFYGMSLFSTF